MTEAELAGTLEVLLSEIRSIRRAASLPTVLSYERAAEELSISKATLKRMLAKGQIIACDVGDGKGIPASEVARIAASEPPPSARRPQRTHRAKAPRGTSERTKIRDALREARRKQA